MKTYILFGFGGSYNHGSEAIAKCTIGILKNICPDCKILLSTNFKQQDLQFNLPVDEYLQKDEQAFNKSREQKNYTDYNDIIYKSTINAITKDSVCISIGGDNYCYPAWHRQAYINRHAKQIGAKTVLLGCSIQSDMLCTEMKNDLLNYDIIIARESLTYNLLCSFYPKNKLYLLPDPAFFLPAVKTDLPPEFMQSNTVGINLSPLFCRSTGSFDTAVQHIYALIKHILTTTEFNITFIPHVNMQTDNDYDLLLSFYKNFAASGRVSLIDNNLSCSEYKYIISQCRFLIAARTHASIAAYSSKIPVLVLGYSVKAQGLAHDIMPKSCNSIINAKQLSANALIGEFNALCKNEQKIKESIQQYISSMVEPAYNKYLTILASL